MYGKMFWKIPHKGEKLSATKEKDKKASETESYAVAWTLKRKCKLTLDVVGYIPHELSRFISFFLVHSGNIEASVLSLQSKLSPDPRGVLEIILKASLRLKNKILIN